MVSVPSCAGSYFVSHLHVSVHSLPLPSFLVLHWKSLSHLPSASSLSISTTGNSMTQGRVFPQQEQGSQRKNLIHYTTIDPDNTLEMLYVITELNIMRAGQFIKFCFLSPKVGYLSPKRGGGQVGMYRLWHLTACNVHVSGTSCMSLVWWRGAICSDMSWQLWAYLCWHWELGVCAACCHVLPPPLARLPHQFLIFYTLPSFPTHQRKCEFNFSWFDWTWLELLPGWRSVLDLWISCNLSLLGVLRNLPCWIPPWHHWSAKMPYSLVKLWRFCSIAGWDMWSCSAVSPRECCGSAWCQQAYGLCWWSTAVTKLDHFCVLQCNILGYL